MSTVLTLNSPLIYFPIRIMESNFPSSLKKYNSTENFEEEDSFGAKVRKAIKVSPKNVFIQMKLRSVENTIERDSDDKTTIKTIGSARSFKSVPDEIIVRVNEKTCPTDPCFFISHKNLKHLLGFPYRVEIKLKVSKQNFKTLYELGKQQLYLILAQESLHSLSKANLYPENEKSRILEYFISIRYPKVMKEDRTGCCGKRKKLNIETKYQELYAKITTLPNSIEKNLLLMEMSANSLVKVGAMIEPWQFYARQILTLNKYCGYMAFAGGYLSIETAKGINLLQKLIHHYPNTPEAYIVLWEHFYFHKDYLNAFIIIDKSQSRLQHKNFFLYSNLFVIIYIKTLFKLKRYKAALELLIQKYTSSRNNLFYLYLFGKSCIKSKIKKFQAAGLSALKEVLRWIKDFSKVSYWYGRVCYKSGKLLKAKKHFQKVLLSLNRNQFKYSVKIQKYLSCIEMDLQTLNSFRQMIEKHPYLNLSSRFSFKINNRHKIILAEVLIKRKDFSKAIDVLQQVNNFQAFNLLYRKIIKELPMASGRTLLVNKIEAMHSCAKVPLFEFIESCIIFSDYLIKNHLDQVAFQILNRLLIFYPSFENELLYVNQENSFWQSMNVLIKKQTMKVFNKKELVMRSVIKALNFKDSKSGPKENSSTNRGHKVKSNSLVDTSSALNASKSIQDSENGQISIISHFGVYTDGALLLKIASLLENNLESISLYRKCLEDYIQISRKPQQKSEVLLKLSKLS